MDFSSSLEQGVIMYPLPKAFLSASIIAMGLVIAPAMAQTATLTQYSAPVHPAAPAIQPNDAQLQKFAKASQKVAVVANEYQAKVQSAPDADTR